MGVGGVAGAADERGGRLGRAGLLRRRCGTRLRLSCLHVARRLLRLSLRLMRPRSCPQRAPPLPLQPLALPLALQPPPPDPDSLPDDPQRRHRAQNHPLRRTRVSSKDPQQETEFEREEEEGNQEGEDHVEVDDDRQCRTAANLRALSERMHRAAGGAGRGVEEAELGQSSGGEGIGCVWVRAWGGSDRRCAGSRGGCATVGESGDAGRHGEEELEHRRQAVLDRLGAGVLEDSGERRVRWAAMRVWWRVKEVGQAAV